MSELKFMQSNEAMTEGAIATGARFYAGYPVIPYTEVAETSSVRLPQVGGLYVQMEVELDSIAAIIGAAYSDTLNIISLGLVVAKAGIVSANAVKQELAQY